MESRQEDSFWDFKQKFHSNSAALLHDIICMANNLVDRDAYIIFGVADKTFEVVGVENDENRRNQQHMIDLLKHKKFVSGIRPRVEVKTLILSKHEVDVLIIKNSIDTPHFLIEDFSENGKRIEQITSTPGLVTLTLILIEVRILIILSISGENVSC
ncbi:ATP-binding protein [Paenibacillus qinlingensis]|nr:ATP-binding protein [Paenibacillus qinlingensis]